MNTASKKRKGNNTLGFTTVQTNSKFLQRKIALTDEVYPQQYRTPDIADYDYVYQVIEQHTTTKFKCKFLNLRVKTDNPDADFEVYRDVEDRQHEEIQEVSISIVESARERYLLHTRRINLVQKRIERENERAEALEYATQRANGMAAATDGACSRHDTAAILKDLTDHVAKNGAKGRDPDTGKSLLDLQFEVVSTHEKPGTGKKAGKMVTVEVRKCVSTQDVHNSTDTGSMWKKIETGMKKGDTPYGIRCRYLWSVKPGKDSSSVVNEIVPSTSNSKEQTVRDKTKAEMQLVLATVTGHISQNAMRNRYMDEFLEDNCKTIKKLPHRVKFNQYVRVMSDVLWEEIVNIITEMAELLDGPFISLCSDFYRDRYRKEDYGSLMCHTVGRQYRLRRKDRLVFMSTKTKNRLLPSQILQFFTNPITGELKFNCMAVAELLLDFLKYEVSKTATNTGTWQVVSAASKACTPKLVYHNSLDGGALAGGKVYDQETRSERTHDTETEHCNFHCGSLSSSEGLGIKKTVNNENPELGKIMKKLHRALAKMYRKSKLIKAYRDFQSARRNKPVSIVPANETRMDRNMEEAAAYNMARGDIEDAYAEIIGSNKKYLEDDSDDEKEGESCSVEKLLPTTSEQEVLRQIECGYEAAVKLSKYTQTREDQIIFEMLFMVRWTIQEMRQSTFATYEDISTDENVKDLHDRKRSVLVRSSSSRLTRRPDNMTVVDMREEVETARFVYAKNLSYRFGLTDAEGNDVKKLPSTTVFAAILHPL